MRETTKRWIARYLSIDGEVADWVLEPQGGIKKANLTFTDNFLWLIVRHCLSPTTVDNIITWDCAVLMAAMIAGFEVYLACLLQAVMHERAFKVTTTNPFSCTVFALCRSSGLPIWHIDHIKTPPGNIDIGLIRAEVNKFAPCRATQRYLCMVRTLRTL